MADAGAHGDAVDVSASHGGAIEDGDGVLGETDGGIGRLLGFVALTGAAMVVDDDAVVLGEIAADQVPDVVVDGAAGICSLSSIDQRSIAR